MLPQPNAYFADLETLWEDYTATAAEERELLKRHGIEPVEI